MCVFQWWVPGAVARRGYRVRSGLQSGADIQPEAAEEGADGGNSNAVGGPSVQFSTDKQSVTGGPAVLAGKREQSVLGLVVAPADADGNVRLIWSDGKPSGGGWTKHGVPKAGEDPRDLRPCYKDEDSVLAACRSWCRKGAFVRHEGRDGQLCVVTAIAEPGEHEEDEPYAEVTWTTGIAHVTAALQSKLGLRHGTSASVTTATARAKLGLPQAPPPGHERGISAFELGNLCVQLGVDTGLGSRSERVWIARLTPAVRLAPPLWGWTRGNKRSPDSLPGDDAELQRLLGQQEQALPTLALADKRANGGAAAAPTRMLEYAQRHGYTRPDPPGLGAPPPADDQHTGRSGSSYGSFMSLASSARSLSAHDIAEYARAVLQLNPVYDASLLWIAEEGLAAPLPQGWAEHSVEGGGDEMYHLSIYLSVT